MTRKLSLSHGRAGRMISYHLSRSLAAVAEEERQDGQDADASDRDSDPSLVKSGVLEKKVIATVVSWKPQQVVLAKERLTLMKAPSPDDDVSRPPSIETKQVLDWIPLTEVQSIVSEHGKFIRENWQMNSARPSRRAKDKSGTHARGQAKAEAEDAERAKVLVIKTTPDGHNMGRAYVFRTQTAAECAEWVFLLRSAIHDALYAAAVEAQVRELKGSLVLRARYYASALYNAEYGMCQMCVCVIICGSFICDVLQAEYLPEIDVEDTASNWSWFAWALSTAQTSLDVFFCFELSVWLL